MSPEPLENILVIRGVIEVDSQYVYLAMPVKFGDSVLRLLGYLLCDWGVEEKNVVECAGGEKRQDGPGLFLMVNQPVEIRIMKSGECQQNIRI